MEKGSPIPPSLSDPPQHPIQDKISTHSTGPIRYQVKNESSSDWTRTLQKTGAFIGVALLGYTFYYGFKATMSGNNLGTIRAMGYRIGVQTGIFAIATGSLVYSRYGSPLSIYGQWKDGSLFQPNSEQVSLQRRHKD